MKSVSSERPSELRSHIGFWLRAVSNHVSHSFAQKLLDSGVTVAEWVILREMYGRPGTAPSELAKLTGLTRGAVSKLVDRLAAKELIARTYAKDDRRFQAIALTAGGTRLVPKLAVIADENDTEFFAGLSGKKRRKFLSTLTQLGGAHGLKTLSID